MKSIAIVGGGISGIFTAIKIKEKNSNYNVSVFEHNNKLLKKLYITGNGKCNFANSYQDKGYYKNNEFVRELYKKVPQNEIISFFKDLGIVIKNIDGLYYPESLTAITVANALLNKIKALKIDIKLEEDVMSYNCSKNLVNIITNKKEYLFDKVVFAIGGKSFKSLGNDGLLFEEIKNHGYSIQNLKPSLCPIHVKEKTKSISGLRREANVVLKVNKQIVYKDSGEVLFKDDGLSGIVIFNVSHLANIYEGEKEIIIDIAPSIKENILENKYESYFHPLIAKYLIDNKMNPHQMIFHYLSNYDFEFSQVSDGGIDINNINQNLMSNIESNVYFTGEMIDVSGICGGYNIMFCYLCALVVANNI